MIDLFGMSKAAQDPPPAEPRKPQAGSHGLWLFLLVLDSIFVIVFGGAVAAKVYQYWKTPAVAAAPVARRRPAPRPSEAAPAPEPARASKPAALAAAAANPAAKPQPRLSRRGETPRPPKPSLITKAPRPRSTPALATSPSAARAASPSAPTKALPVVFKLHASRAGAVQLVGAFIVHGGRKEMTKGSGGQWTLKLYLNPGQYRYFFSVDKKKTLDPENPHSERGASLLTVP